MVQTQQFGGDWTTEKLDRLRKYLAEYTKILSKQSFTYAYIDAFAGTGYRKSKETRNEEDLLLPELADLEAQRFLQGSARIALECEPAFHKYIFIEKNEEKLAELQSSLSREFSEKENHIIFIRGDANTVIQDLCEKDWRWHRAVLFLDPYGMQVAWPTIEAVARTEAIDLWILFPLGVAVNRMLTKDGQINEKWKHRLDEMFGSGDWYNAFYRANSQTSLLDEAPKMQKTADFSVILAYYVDRLKTVFRHVAENPLQLYNSKNNPLYALFFAAGNPKGGKIAVKIARYILGN
jgi:three-Cys-motif partner protein